jgi:hypothetical protein
MHSHTCRLHPPIVFTGTLINAELENFGDSLANSDMENVAGGTDIHPQGPFCGVPW